MPDDRCLHRCHYNPFGCTKEKAINQECDCGFYCFYTDCQQDCDERRTAYAESA